MMKTRKLIVNLAMVLSAGIMPALWMSTNGASAAAASDTKTQSNAPATSSEAYSPLSREYHLKAAFLRYVAKFVEWPPNSISGGNINLCILGLIPSFEAINSINGKDANDKKIVVTKISEINEAKGKCQILFVTKTEEDNISKIIKATGDLPILTFGDMEHFAEKGGNMNFYVLNNRLAIMINPPTVEKAQLKISERMLKVVTVIPPVEQSKRPSSGT
ncbi:MAG: YfiR family protein [Proteobacteria bacterium]|nr:YfiR family protein [Pseudomonadota bacterium]